MAFFGIKDLSSNPRDWIKRSELKGAKSLSFPPQIDGVVPNFFEMKFVNYNRNETLQKAAQDPNSYTLFLPVPADLTDETLLDYEEYQSFGGVDKLLQGRTSSDFVSAMKEVGGGGLKALVLGGVAAAPQMITGAAKAGSVALANTSPGISAALGAVGAGANFAKRASSVIRSQAGALVNPALAVEFKGVQRKNYEFSWRMVATSQDESVLINKIIDCIRWNSLPEKVAEDWILTYPNIAFLKFHGNLEYGTSDAPRQIIQFAPQGAIITNMRVTYNGSSSEQIFFADTGEPVEVQLNLSFSDRGILTRELIDTSWK